MRDFTIVWTVSLFHVAPVIKFTVIHSLNQVWIFLDEIHWNKIATDALVSSKVFIQIIDLLIKLW